MQKCEWCGSTSDVKYIGVGVKFLWICYACYMKDDSTSYAFGASPDAGRLGVKAEPGQEHDG